MTEAHTQRAERNTFWYLFLGFLFLFPLFVVPGFSVPTAYAKIFFLTLGTTVFSFLMMWEVFKKKQATLSVHPISITLSAVFLATLLSAIFSNSFWNSFLGNGSEISTVLAGFLFLVFYFVSVRVANSPSRVFVILGTLAVSALLLALFQIVHVGTGGALSLGGLFPNMTSTPIGKWNDLSVFFGAFALLSYLALSFVNLPGRVRALLWVLFGFAMIILSTVNFPIVWVVFGVSVLLSFISQFVSAGKTKPKKNPVSLATTIALLFVLLNVIPFFSQSGTQERHTVGETLVRMFGISTLEARPSWSGTTDVALSTLAKDPVFGIGANRFQIAWSQSKAAEINNTLFWNTDFSYGVGLVPTRFVTEGIVGGIAWIVFFVFFIIAGCKVIFEPIQGDIKKFLPSALWWTAAFFWVLTVLYVPGPVTLLLPFLFTALFVGLAFPASTKEYSFGNSPKMGFVYTAVLIVITLSLLFALTTVFLRVIAVHDFSRAVMVFNKTGSLDEVEALVKTSTSLAGVDTYSQSLTELSLVRLNRLLADTSKAPEVARAEFSNLLSDAIIAGQSAVAADPENFRNYIALGRVYEAVVPLKITGAYEAAKTAYQTALQKAPLQPLIYLSLARLESVKPDPVATRTELSKALSLKGDYTEALLFLALLEVQAGNSKNAIKALESTLSLEPNRVGALFELGFLKYDTKDYAGARDALLRAVSVSPAYANARYYLGLSYDKLGKTAEAIAQFEEILKTNPDNTEVGRILQNLKAGRSALENASEKPEKRKKPPVSEE